MIQQLLQESLNHDVIAENILVILQEHEGKRLDKRIIDKIKKIADNVYMNKTFNYTYIEWGGYRTSGGKKGGELCIANHIKHVYINTKEIEEKNHNYFAGRIAKNKEIQQLINNEKEIKSLEVSIQQFKDAEVNLSNMLNKFSVIHYKIKEKYKIK